MRDSNVAPSTWGCYSAHTRTFVPLRKTTVIDLAKASVLGNLNYLEELMATATKKAPAAKKATVSAKKAPTPVAKKATVSAKKTVSPATKTANATPLKPIKDSFTKASLSLHLAERAGVEPKAAKALMAALEETVLASVHKKGAKEFTLPGLLKVVAQDVPAKKKRFGKDPFSGEDKWFAAKPASVRLKVRPLKKLKDAAL
jgi:nucleoid DNA-binding protein